MIRLITKLRSTCTMGANVTMLRDRERPVIDRNLSRLQAASKPVVRRISL